MRAVTTPSFLPTPISYIPFLKPPPNAFSTLQLRRRNPHPPVAASSQDTEAEFSAIQPDPSSDSNTTKKAQPREKPKPKKGEELSGSDILRALQKASAKKANTKKKRQSQHNNKGSSEFKNKSTHTGSSGKKGVDLGKVRPITIKSDWATRLTDLEKRLQQFSAF